MMQTGIRLKVNPEILQKLRSADAVLWTAAHRDGSDNRINWDAVVDADIVGSISLSILAVAFQGVRKAFRNRAKTKEDLAAEKEAAKINRTCGALSQMLLEYMEAAQAGSVDGESLDELIDVLKEMAGYDQAGKLTIADAGALPDICQSITAYTAALTGGGNEQPARGPEITASRAFRQIRVQLIRQRERIGEEESAERKR